MDSVGKWSDALEAFSEGYRQVLLLLFLLIKMHIQISVVILFLCCRIACEANLLSVQLSALENMHYSHMIRFDNHEEAR